MKTRKREKEQMTKQKLKFKVDGGLRKLADFYDSAQQEKSASEAYWNNPAALLEALDVAPEKEIRISGGYKKLADTMDSVDFKKWNDTFDHDMKDNGLYVQPKPYASLWNAVDPESLQAGDLGDAFDRAYNVVVVLITITVTVTVTSGYIRDEDSRRPATPNAPKFSGIPQMSSYAQSVADQVGWFS
ncbi:MAG: hypothetical protein GC185_07105 [Alphaproteobacteria bacterium]|nr:hypothetical protein [Alphaproteobacteria bacterium]